MELLSPYRTEIDGTRHALQKDAELMGVPLDELWTKVVAEWDEAGNMKARWLPRAFRDGRAIFDLSFPIGWWVDVNTTEAISAINDRFDARVPTAGGPVAGTLTLSQLTSDDRILTTAIARWLREDVAPHGCGSPTRGEGGCRY
ncbi:MAG TPA: hypothetical protein VIJ18_00865 [Microbacteriaceae bacterium]